MCTERTLGLYSKVRATKKILIFAGGLLLDRDTTHADYMAQNAHNLVDDSCIIREKNSKNIAEAIVNIGAITQILKARTQQQRRRKGLKLSHIDLVCPIRDLSYFKKACGYFGLDGTYKIEYHTPTQETTSDRPDLGRLSDEEFDNTLRIYSEVNWQSSLHVNNVRSLLK